MGSGLIERIEPESGEGFRFSLSRKRYQRKRQPFNTTA